MPLLTTGRLLPSRFNHADCTHWCFVSGALEYMRRVVVNTMIAFNATTRSYNRKSAWRDLPDNTLVQGSVVALIV